MPVPMLDLKAQYNAIRDDIDAAVAEVFSSQQFRGGPKVEDFERAIADYVGAPWALGVATGTDALLLALKALDIGPGDEVITTPFTFFATAGAIANAGATPVFVDIEPRTCNLEPALIEDVVTERTRAVLPVHLFGQCADMDRIHAIAQTHGLCIIEDAAQAIGASYKGRRACTMGEAAALSFYPTKNLGAAGEGGMIVANDDGVAEKVRLLRCHGSDVTYNHIVIGTNSHLHAVQAAVLMVKLAHLEVWNDARRANARRYDDSFAEVPEVTVPYVEPHNHHVYHQYVIRLPRRDEARDSLLEQGIGCGVFYPRPLHLQECFRHLGCRPDQCPEAIRASEEVLALPICPEITPEQQDEVVGAIKKHLARG